MPFAVSQAMPLQSTGQGSPSGGQKAALQAETADSVSGIHRTCRRIASYAALAVSLIKLVLSNVGATVGVMQLMIADAQLVPGLLPLSRARPLASSTRELRE